MTVATAVARNDYLPNGATTVFPYTFRILAATDLRVVKRSAGGVETVLVYNADYTVSGVGNTAGGSVTLFAAPASGEFLTLRRGRSITQGTDLANQGRNSPADTELALDSGIMISQQLQDQLDRTFKIGETFNPAGYNLVLPTPTAGLVLTGTGTGFTMAQIVTAAAVALPGQSRVTSTLSAYLANNAYFNPKDYAGGTKEAQITNAIAAAAGNGGLYVVIPASMVPYNPAAVTFNTAVRLVREGGSGGVYDIFAYGGKQATTSSISLALRQAVKAAQANGGGTIRISSEFGPFVVLDSDACADIALYSKAPILFQWENIEVRVKVTQTTRSHHTHAFAGTSFVLKDENGTRVTGSVYPFYANASDTTPAAGVASTSGSATVVMANPADPLWGKLDVGSPLLLDGSVPPLAVDTTTINIGGGISAVDTTITVVSTAAFAAASTSTWPVGGKLRIENELISYTSKDATHFLGCTRGAGGTTAAAHANSIRVDRVSYQPFYVVSISGSNITLDAPANITATGLSAQIGVLDVSFDGVADFDGNKDTAADDAGNPQAMWIIGGRRLSIGASIKFRNWDHGAWTLTGCLDSVVYGRGFDIGAFTTAAGSSFWVFGWNKRITADILEVHGGITGISVDDRSNSPQLYDGPAEDCSIRVRQATGMGVPGGVGSGIILVGSRGCFASIERALFISGLAGCNGIVLGGQGQWADETTNPAINNVLDIGYVNAPDFTHTNVNVSVGGNATNFITLRARASQANLQPANSLTTPDFMPVSLTYGATVSTSASLSDVFTLNVTNGVAFAVANPTNLTSGRRVEFYIANTSGGAMGAVTFGSKFRLAGAFVAPAAGQARVYRFRYHQANDVLVEEFRSAADQST